MLERFAFGPSRSDFRSGLTDWARNLIWIFLARGGFGAKTSIYSYWIFLDSLGFSRAKRDLSMGYTG